MPPLLGVSLGERRLEVAKEELKAARSEDDFRRVGAACREVLVYQEQTAPNEAIRSYAKAALALADNLQASTADYEKASACVEATASVVRFISITAGQRASNHTVAELIQRYLQTQVVGVTQSFALQRISGTSIGLKVASKLGPEDIIDYCRRRRATVSAVTVKVDISCLRTVLNAARDKWNLDVTTDAIDQAKGFLERDGLVGRSSPRTRRPTRTELADLIAYFEKQDRLKHTRIPMREIMEFALFSARRISEICSLRWKDVNEKTRTCIVRGVKDPQNKSGRDVEFPLLGKAWDIVQRQPTKHLERIFPYNSTSAGKRYIDAKKVLGIENLRFNDLRREAAIRLYEAGHSVEQISKVTGRLDLNSLLRDIEQGSRNVDASAQHNEAVVTS